MTRSILTLGAFGIALGIGLAAPLAHAQTKAEFGKRGEFIVSADRLFSLFSWSRVAQDDFPSQINPGDTNVYRTRNQTALALFAGPWLTGENNSGVEGHFFTAPRVGVDYTVVPNVTVGGEIILWGTTGGTASTVTEQANGNTRTDSTDINGLFVFGIAPRAGYVLQFNRILSLWLRGGLSFYTGTASTPKDPVTGTYSHVNTNQFSLDLDPQLVISPAEHFGLTVGVTGDIPLVGRHAVTLYGPNASAEESASSSVAFLGLTIGMLGYF